MKKWKVAAGILLGVLMVMALVFSFRLGVWVERSRPGTTVMSLWEYFDMEDAAPEEVLVVLDMQVQKETARAFEEGIYLSFEMVQELFLPRLYLDEYDDLVMLTTPTQVYCYPLNSRTYTVNEKPQETDYPIARWAEGRIWIALDYLKQQVDMETNWAEGAEPDRLVLHTSDGVLVTKDVEKETQIRVRADVKGDILRELLVGERVFVLDEEGENFDRVMTEDGIIGYVRKKHLTERYSVKQSFADRTIDEREAYTSVPRTEPVVMVWHQVFNQTANSYLADKLAQTEGVNVISPTWFSIENNNGKLTTLANKEYVELAHSMGLEVWPLINDFTQGLDYDRIYGSETIRRNLINNIFYFIYTYDLDGINIDFENITEENCRGYIQFLRELSVACRNEGIALSVDNYVPTERTIHYDRTEQGILADYVVVMAYDEHYAGSPVAGSVSSLGWVERAVEATMEEVPAEKLVVALPFYTRLWKESIGEDGLIRLSSEACSMNAGLNLLAQNGVEPEWDPETAQYYGRWEANGVRHHIWLEEERSLTGKLDRISDYGNVGGIAFWKLGLEKSEVWPEIVRWKEHAME